MLSHLNNPTFTQTYLYMFKLTTQLSRLPLSLHYRTLAAYRPQPNHYLQTSQSSIEGEQVPMGSYVYIPRNHNKDYITAQEIEAEAKAIFQWAKGKGAERYSFICHPYTNGVFEKQDSFLNINYKYEKSQLKELISHDFDGAILIRNEADGSSVPSGGLRATHTARAYTLWDPKSRLFLRRSNKTLYIPSLLVTHYGKALGVKTLFRMSEKALETETNILLEKIGIQSKGSKMFLGLEQEFFAIPEEDFNQREDLKWLGRAIVGTNPARHQQLSQHYYAKIPDLVAKALHGAESELLELGIPFKTRHNEVALNQFQIACIYEQAGTCIDKNSLVMQIIKQNFTKHGLTALFHEKPFSHINGSGKHANWNIAYVRPDGNIKNLFKNSESDSDLDKMAYKLFILIQLMAVLKNHKLYLSAIAIPPGNEIRLGGHEAPPRIFSVFCGTALSNLLDGKEPPKVENLRDLVPSLCYDANQENTDRNRTSPFAYTGRVFEFRALGSTQNAAFPMAVIAATMAAEVKEVVKLLESGRSIEDIISQYQKQTQSIRFEGNGYGKEWKEEAKKRGLHVNEKFIDLLNFLDTEQEVFTKIGACSDEENKARAQIYKDNYMGEVVIEVDTLTYIARRHIIPQTVNYLNSIGANQSATLKTYSKDINAKLDLVVEGVSKLESAKKAKEGSLSGCQELRVDMMKLSDLVTDLMGVLPHNPQFPDQSKFLNM